LVTGFAEPMGDEQGYSAVASLVERTLRLDLNSMKTEEVKTEEGSLLVKMSASWMSLGHK
jgi:hypothetical protein